MKKRLIFTLLLPLFNGAYAIAADETTESPSVVAQQITTETLDALLAPVALYPDTVVTHILIASTYPLQVVEADRWRQANAGLEEPALSSALEAFDWDPSVKALVPFTDILHNMSNDLSWLQTLGDAVITAESHVLDRIQALRLQALESGNLASNDYQQVSTEERVVVIEPRQPDVVYIPYYDPALVYGHWHYTTRPVFWVSALHVATRHIFWRPHFHVSASFHFGHIWWPDHHIVISRKPVHRYVKPSRNKHYSAKEYRRWQHNAGKRHARYSKKVITTKPGVVKHTRILSKQNAKAASNARQLDQQLKQRHNKAVRTMNKGNNKPARQQQAKGSSKKAAKANNKQPSSAYAHKTERNRANKNSARATQKRQANGVKSARQVHQRASSQGKSNQRPH